MIAIDTIMQGDSKDILKEIDNDSVDLIVTDPPYGIKRDKGFEGFGGFGKPIARIQYQGDWDSERPDKIYFDEILRISQTAFIFGGNFFADLLPQGKHWVVWDKCNTMPTFGDCELIWTNVDRKSVKKIILEYNGLLGREPDRIHSTQKPVRLIERLLLEYSKEGDLVLDPFAGSMTTAIACINTNRHYICIEKDEKYYRMGVERVNEHRRIKDSQPELEFSLAGG